MAVIANRIYVLTPALRACLKITRGAAARDFGFGQGGEASASPQRAVPTEPTPDKGKRPAAGRFSRTGPPGFVAPQSKTHEGYSPSSRLASQPFARKQHPLEFSDSLSPWPSSSASAALRRDKLRRGAAVVRFRFYECVSGQSRFSTFFAFSAVNRDARCPAGWRKSPLPCGPAHPACETSF